MMPPAVPYRFPVLPPSLPPSIRLSAPRLSAWFLSLAVPLVLAALLGIAPVAASAQPVAPPVAPLSDASTTRSQVEAAAEGQPRGSFGETIDVRLIDVEVVVTDRSGRRVTGLTAEDFRLVVGGQPVPVAFFDEVREGRYVPGKIALDGAAAEPLPEELEPVETSYLIFLDDYFTRPPYRNVVLEGIQDDMERLGPRDRYAVVAYDGTRLEVLTDWTQSRTELRAALDAAAKRDGWKAFLEQQRFQADAQNRAKLVAEQLGRTYQAVATSLRTFADVPGRRVALLVAGGWPYELIGPESDFALSRSQLFDGRRPLSVIADVANATGFTLYPIDAPGSGAAGGNSADLVPSPTELDPDSGFSRGFSELLEGESKEQSLLRLAHWTGGEAQLGGRRLSPLAPVVEDTRSYYWLSFQYPRQGDGGRHEIRVETVRDDLEVRSRTGFVDVSKGAEAEMQAERAILLGGGENTLRVEMGEVQGKGRRVVLPFSVFIPVDQVSLRPMRDGGSLAELELRVAVEDDRGDRTDVSKEVLKLPLPKAMVDQGWVIYDSGVQLRRREHVLVFVLTDPANGTTLLHRAEFDPR